MAEFKEIDKPWGWVFEEGAACSVCGEQINPFGVWHKHPRLKTIQCVDCNKFYSKGMWVKDEDGYYEHCRWCGEGGTLLGCDHCIDSFCRKCIIRNLGRGGITEAENSTKWKCYICAPEKIAKLTEFTRRLQDAGQKRSEWLTQKEIKQKQRHIEKLKAAKNSPVYSTSNLKTCGDKANGEVSTDEDEIDQKIHILTKRLESKIDNPNKTTANKKRVKSIIDSLQKKVSSLATKTKHLEVEWEKLAPTQNGHTKPIEVSSSEGVSGSSSDDADNECALLGDMKKRKRKKRKYDEGPSHHVESSDEYSDEEAAMKLKAKRKEEELKKKEANFKLKLKREAELEAKLIAEEAKRKFDADRLREKRQKGKQRNVKTTGVPDEPVVLSDSNDEQSNVSFSTDSESDDNNSGKKMEKVSSDSDAIPDFLNSSADEEVEAKAESVDSDDAKEISSDSFTDSDDQGIEELIKRKQKTSKTKPAKVNGQSANKESPSDEDNAKPQKDQNSSDENISKNKLLTDKLLRARVTISSDDEPKPEKKKFKSKSNGGQKRKRVAASTDDDVDDDCASGEEESADDVDRRVKKRRKKKKKHDEDSDKENTTSEKPSPEKPKTRKIMTDEKLSETTKKAEQDERDRKARLEKLREERQAQTGMAFETRDWDGILNKEPLVQVDTDLKENLKSHQIEGLQFLWDSIIESVKKEGDEYKLGSSQEGHGVILAHCMGLGKTLQAIALSHTIITHEFIGLSRFVVLCPLNVCENWENEVSKWTEALGQPLSCWNLHSTTEPTERMDLITEWSETGGLLIIGYTLWRMLTTGKNVVNRKAKRLIPKFKELLLEKTDVIICDEGHCLKNAESALSKSVKQIRTKRRIVLTGTPMQNNLDEYHCMVDFVRPNLLGTTKEFRNRFANPIRSGESIDASAFDVKLMKKRAFILHKTLDGVVQRKDYSYMCRHLPPKQEYVLSLKLTDTQAKLYEFYLNNESVALDDVARGTGKVSGRGLFKDFQTFLLVNNHPKALIQQAGNREMRLEKDEFNRFLCDDEDEDRDTDEEEFDEKKLDEMEDNVKPQDPLNEDELKCLSSYKLRSYIIHHQGSLQQCVPSDPRDLLRRATEIFRKNCDPENEFLIEEIESFKRPLLKEFIIKKGGTQEDITGKSKTELRAIARELHMKQVEPPPEMEWYEKCLGLNFDMERFELSRKMEILFEVINMCFHLKDKLIVFSQSVITLDIIESFLAQSTLQGIADIASPNSDDENTNESLPKIKNAFIAGQQWYKNIDYFRIDGSVAASKRTSFIDDFNNPDNPRARLFIVSTKAGGIGTNLVGANRVIIFDSSWNPAHDVQSLFRVYRFGQCKDVFVYRFVGFGTMEEKIYERQVNKSSLGLRVVDEQQVDRHYSAEQLKELYKFHHEPKEPVSQAAPPKDPILGEILRGEKTKGWVLQYHQHDSLLEHRPEEQLSTDEIAKAWEEYDNEKKGIFTHMYAPQATFGGSFNVPYDSNLMTWQPLSIPGMEGKCNKSNWLNSISKLTLEKLVQSGKTHINDYKLFFSSRKTFDVATLMELLFTYNHSIPYSEACRIAHQAYYNIYDMQSNERNMYRMGVAIYKQCEQRLSELNLQELQNRMMQQQRRNLPSVNKKNIQPKATNILLGNMGS